MTSLRRSAARLPLALAGLLALASLVSRSPRRPDHVRHRAARRPGPRSRVRPRRGARRRHLRPKHRRHLRDASPWPCRRRRHRPRRRAGLHRSPLARPDAGGLSLQGDGRRDDGAGAGSGGVAVGGVVRGAGREVAHQLWRQLRTYSGADGRDARHGRPPAPRQRGDEDRDARRAARHRGRRTHGPAAGRARRRHGHRVFPDGLACRDPQPVLPRRVVQASCLRPHACRRHRRRAAGSDCATRRRPVRRCTSCT